MENQLSTSNNLQFHRLKLAKKQELTKRVFSLEFVVPDNLELNFNFKAGQYIRIKHVINDKEVERDFSIISAPFENKLKVAIKINNEKSFSNFLFNSILEDDVLEVSEPSGRFYLSDKPNEKRTIIAFASGIGITPIFSQIKHILYTEPFSRIFLFYGNKSHNDIVFKSELENLKIKYNHRLQVYYFLSQETMDDALMQGRIDEKKVKLIINQILHLDDEYEESTIWDSTDEVLICGPGEMIKSVANACYENGIPKKNIHFELFEAFNDDIYPQEKEFPIIENINVQIKINHQVLDNIVLKNNKTKLLQQLLDLGYHLPYSCKSGVCGNCICHLTKGEVESTEDEYLTDKEKKQNKILPCVSFVLSKDLFLDFD